jgi:hypothetical protein
MASAFDNEDIVAAPAAAKKSAFDEADVVESAPVKKSAFAAEDVAEPAELPEIKPKDDIDFTVNPAELQEIAARRGVKPEDVASWVPLYGGTAQEGGDFKWSQVPAAVAGRTAGLLTGGLAPDAIKKLAIADPKMRAALDDVEDLLYNKRGVTGKVADTASELGTAIAGGSALFKGAGKALGASDKVMKYGEPVAELVGAGAQGLFQSKEGEEVKDVLINAGLLLGLKGAGKLYTKARTAASERALKQLSEELADVNTVEAVDKAMQAAAPAEEALKKAVLAKTTTPTKVVRDLAPEEIDAIAERAGWAQHEASDSITNSARRLLGLENPEADKVAAVASYIRHQRSQLRNSLGAGNTRTFGVGEAVEQQGEEFVSRSYDNLRKAQYALEHLRGEGLDQTTREGRKLGKIGLGRRVGIFLSDARHVYDAIDNRYGTELTPVLDRMSNRYNGYTHAASKLLKAQQPLVTATRNAEPLTKQGEKFTEAAWDALNRGEFPSERFTPDQLEVLQSWKKHFSDLADTVDNLHVQYPELKLSATKLPRISKGPEGTYVPHQVVDGPEYVARVRNAMSQLGTTDARTLFSEAGAGNQQAQDIISALEVWSGREIEHGRDAVDALNSLNSLEKTGDALFTNARALFKRGNEIPDFVMEKDISKLSQRWTNNTLRHLFLRDSLNELANASEVIRGVSPTLGEYIGNHVKDLSGVRRKTVAGIAGQYGEKFTADMEERALIAREQGNEKAARMYDVLSKHDDYARAATSNMYTYFLGLRPDAAIRNLAQPIFMTAPHIPASNPLDAARRVGAAYKDSLKELATNRKAVIEEMRRKGQIPTESMLEAQHWLERGLAESGDPKIIEELKKGNKFLSDLAMAGYRASDAYNRLVTKHIADGLIRDAFAYARGDVNAATKNALLAIQGASPGYRSLMERALRNGDEAAAKQAMEDYLIGHTQFNYNRASMSEYGRAMGKMFSMFSKWPTSVIGEVLGSADAAAIGKRMPNNETKILWKYMGPTMLAWWAQDNYWDEIAESDTVPAKVATTLMGKNLMKWTPGDTLVGLAREGQVSRLPPAFEAVGGAVSHAAKGEYDKALETMYKNSVSMMPYGYMTRLVEPFLED